MPDTTRPASRATPLEFSSATLTTKDVPASDGNERVPPVATSRAVGLVEDSGVGNVGKDSARHLTTRLDETREGGRRSSHDDAVDDANDDAHDDAVDGGNDGGARVILAAQTNDDRRGQVKALPKGSSARVAMVVAVLLLIGAAVAVYVKQVGTSLPSPSSSESAPALR
ncbi:MAG: hypothetical protein NVS3B20_23250 [Polyangiales bacterium]